MSEATLNDWGFYTRPLRWWLSLLLFSDHVRHTWWQIYPICKSPCSQQKRPLSYSNKSHSPYVWSQINQVKWKKALFVEGIIQNTMRWSLAVGENKKWPLWLFGLNTIRILNSYCCFPFVNYGFYTLLYLSMTRRGDDDNIRACGVDF